jgi:spermidine/putrescine transport system substrate-binding protein
MSRCACHFGLAFKALILTLLFSSHSAHASDKVLKLYNWEDYMPDSVLKEFEQKTGYKVEQIYYESDDLKDELILQDNGKGLDLMIGSGSGFINYVRHGNILSQLNRSQMPNLKHIDPAWNERHPTLTSYGVPFLWGTLGIVYRKDKVDEHVDSWAQILKPKEKYRNKILMIDDIRDLFSAALKLSGHSVNETNPHAIKQAGKLLLEQKPYVKSYQYFDLTENSELLKQDIVMAIAYSGDAIALSDHSDNIGFVVPKEGTNLWVDYITVLESSEHKEAAMQFINFINTPRIAKQLAEELYYASPNLAAEKLLPAEHLTNPLIYPPSNVLKNSESLHALKGRATVFYNQYYDKLMHH